MYETAKFMRKVIELRSTDRRGMNFLYLSIALIIFGDLVFCVALFSIAPEQAIRALGPVLILLIATATLFLLLRGRRLAAMRLLVYGAWLTLATTGVVSAGIHVPGASASALIVVMAGWLLGRWHALLLAALTIITSFMLAVGELTHLLPLWPQAPTPAMVLWVAQAMIVAIAAALIAYVLRSYDERYRQARQIAENVPAMIFHGDRELRCRFANRRYAEFYGYAEPTILGMNLRDIVGPSVFGGIRDKLDQTLAGETVSYRGLRRHAANGDLHHLEITLAPDIDQDGRIDGFYALIQDITDRLRAEESLRRSEEKFAKAFQHNPMPMAMVRQRDARYVEVNQSWESMLGWTRAEAVGKTGAELGIWPDNAAHNDWLATIARESRMRDSVVTLRIKSGQERQVILSAELIDVAGEACSLCMAMDVTERLQVEAELRSSKEKFTKIFQLTPLASAIVSLRTSQFVEVNSAWENLLGRKRDEALGHTALELGIWPNPAARERSIFSLLKTGDVRNDEIDFLTRDGQMRQILISADLIELDGEPCSLSMAVDITERKKVELALRESEARARAIADGSSVGIFMLTPVSQTVYTNPAIHKIIGCSAEETLGLRWADFIHPDDRARIHALWLECVQDGIVHDTKFRFVRKDGDIRYVHVRTMPVEEGGRLLCYVGNVEDVTDRQHAEKALRKSEEKLAKMFHASPVAISLSRLRDGLYLDVNEAYVQQFGWSREEMLGRTSTELGLWGVAARNRWISELQATGRTQGFEATFRARSGTEHSILVSAERFDLETEACVIALIYDITDRKRAEEALSRSEARARVMAEESSIGIFLGAADGETIYTNPAIHRIIGCDAEDTLGVNWVEHIHPDDRENTRQAWLACVAHRVEFELDYRFLRNDGSVRYVHVKAMAVNEGDHLLCYVGNVEDTTDRRRAEEALRQSEARARAVAESSSVGIFLTEPDGKALYINPALQKILACTLEESLGFGWTSYLHPGDAERVHGAWRQFVGNDTAFDLEYRFVRRDGIVRFVHVNVMAVQAGEHVDCYVGNVEDITERKRADEEVFRLNAELESRVQIRTSELLAANRELESFAYSISHDLRAPLRGIDGFSQLLLDEYGDKLDRQGHDYLARVRRAAQRMGILIDDLLELSRVTRQGMRRQSVNLGQLAHDILDEFRKSYPQRSVEISVVADCPVEGDPQLLRVLLENLLDNAWKYTSKTAEAQIEFGVEASAQGPVYFVRDNGAGFDMQYADRLFRPFQRLHSPEDFTGTGVGLASVARVVHRHGGRVWAESSIGQGAIFRFTLGHIAPSKLH